MGWAVSVYTQSDGGASPATESTPAGRCVGEYRADIFGMDWLDALAKEGKAVDLGGNGGYPWRFTVPAKHAVAHLPAAASCRPEEWLLVEAWDTS